MKLLKLFGITLLALTIGGCALTGQRENHGEYKGYVQWHPQSGEKSLSSVGTTCYFCPFQKEVMDSDSDGVLDPDDKCPDTPIGVKVSPDGCQLDSDGDGVYDGSDRCPDTQRGVSVDAEGCPLDSDGDGVSDDNDRCPGTPPNLKVNTDGCQLALDTDNDSVIDAKDKCPGTPRGATVNIQGCWVLNDLNFDTGRSSIKGGGSESLDAAAKVLRKNPRLKVEIMGHTDSTGTASFNQMLSEKRAKTVFNALVSRGVSPDRLFTRGYSESKPITSNETRSGRAMNRRVHMNLIP